MTWEDGKLAADGGNELGLVLWPRWRDGEEIDPFSVTRGQTPLLPLR